MSSPESELSRTSRVLAGKAEEDATAVREFGANSEIADSIIGFHAQQAVEKWLKAVTASVGVRHSAIHDLDRLMEVLQANGVDPPLDRDRLVGLTQFAVPLRYDELLDAESLDRETIVGLVEGVRDWAEARLRP